MGGTERVDAGHRAGPRGPVHPSGSGGKGGEPDLPGLERRHHPINTKEREGNRKARGERWVPCHPRGAGPLVLADAGRGGTGPPTAPVTSGPVGRAGGCSGQ